MNNRIIRWETPPEGDKRGSRYHVAIDWHGLAAQLRDRPGEWGLLLVGGFSTTMASNIRYGRVAAFKPCGAYEARAVRISGVPHLYAVYGAPNSPSTTESDE